MAHKTTRRGGRSWWGKAEAKAAGRITRRRDDLLVYADEDVDRETDEIDRMMGREPLAEAEKTDMLARDLGYLDEED